MRFTNIRNTLILRLYGFLKIPLFSFCAPTIIEDTPQRFVLKIPLNFRTRNHLGVMYFGALNIGAEACIGIAAFKQIYESGIRIDFLFRDYRANFLRRAEGDVLFICDEIQKVTELINQAKTSEDRLNSTIKSYAVVPSIDPSEKIAEFEVTLTVRRRRKS